jgi:hypothetical protein
MQIAHKHFHETYKVRAVCLAYLSVLETKKDIPFAFEIELLLRDHFRQEFALDVLLRGQLQTLGTYNKTEFERFVSDGKYDGNCPNRREMIEILQAEHLAFIDEIDRTLYEFALRGVW